jgi:hypothetical protein
MLNRVTMKQINDALEAAGFDERLHRGDEGYFYFYGGTAEHWDSSSVYVYRTSEFTVEQWVEECRQFKHHYDQKRFRDCS